MKFSVVLALVAMMVVVASAISTERINALKAQVEAEMEVGSMANDMEAQSIFRRAEADVAAQIAAGAKGLTCSAKITWAGAVSYFAKKKNAGAGVKKFEEWAAGGTPVATIWIEANASASAGLGISAGLGVAFEFAVEWAGAVPSFKDAAVSLCANFDINIGIQFGASAGGTLYLIFGDMAKAETSNCGIGAEVFAGIGGGIQLMLKCPEDKAGVVTAWNTLKATWSTIKTADGLAGKLKEIVKAGAGFAKATIIGVAFSAGVGVGGTPVSATYSIADMIKKAIPDAWSDYANNAADSIKGKWAQFKAWVKK